MNHVYVQTYNVEHDSFENRKKNDELSFALFSMKKNNQFFSNSETAKKMNIENNSVHDENIESIASHAYVNLIVKTKILSTEKLVSAIQIRAFHV
jgi:hypothetical protein